MAVVPKYLDNLSLVLADYVNQMCYKIPLKRLTQIVVGLNSVRRNPRSEAHYLHTCSTQRLAKSKLTGGIDEH